MHLFRMLPLIALLSCLLLAQASAETAADTTGNGTESFIRFFSPEMRRIDDRLGKIASDMIGLPAPKQHPWGSRYGHRSADLPTESTPDWLQMDFGRTRDVQMIALMPVNLSYQGTEGAGYGFPKRFRIEISDHADMRDATVVVDRGAEDVINPGTHPLVYEFAPVRGRYLRFTSTKHQRHQDLYFWALEELFVWEGNIMASAGALTSFSSNMDLYPQWAPVRINDSQSTLGMPVDVKSVSPSLGYLSAKSTRQEVENASLPSTKKWCAVDLGESTQIEEVRVLPLESDAYEVTGGRGFPRQFQVQLANDPEFLDVVWQAMSGNFPLGYPDGCPIHMTVPQIKARYVRVLTVDLWSRDDWYLFGLSELQVYDSQRNVALGKRVFAKDVSDKKPQEGWSPHYLVDGFSSRYRLTEWPDYLRLMDLRGRLVRETEALKQKRATIVSRGKNIIGASGVALAILIVGAWIWSTIRHRAMRRRDVEQLRQQIARDLHDDIGSNLGGIVLLSEIGSAQSRDEESRADFEAIRRAAEEASLSMRDIIWLIQREPVGLKEFVTRMRQSLRAILNHPDVSLEVEPMAFPDRALGLRFRRHVFLAFKEALNNVRKHAQTRLARVRVEIETDRLRFTVSDDGIGFDPDKAVGTGHGLDNLKRRASRIEGSVRIDSAPGKGTRITFEAPFTQKKNT